VPIVSDTFHSLFRRAAGRPMEIAVEGRGPFVMDMQRLTLEALAEPPALDSEE